MYPSDGYKVYNNKPTEQRLIPNQVRLMLGYRSLTQLAWFPDVKAFLATCHPEQQRPRGECALVS